MKHVQVDLPAVELLASRCRAWAAELATVSPLECGSLPSTAAALAFVQSELGTAAAALAARMGETADLLDDVARHFRAGDSRWATEFA